MLVYTNTDLKCGIFGVSHLHKRDCQFSSKRTWSLTCLPACLDARNLTRHSVRYTKMSSQVVEKMGSNGVVKEYSQDSSLPSSYETAMEALSSLITSPKRGGKSSVGGTYTKLERMSEYLKILGLEEQIEGLKIIHVAGTKGKGSTCTFSEAILRECSFRIGLFTSPHLIDEISEDKFLRYFWECWNRLKGLIYQKLGYESSTGRKEDGSRTAVQIIIPGLEIPRWLSYQRLGNSISIDLPPNLYNCMWMGFALCASFNSPPSYDDEFGNPIKTFGLRACVIALGDMPHSHYASEIFFNVKVAPKHIWLLYLSRDDWLATVDGEYSKIEVVFETYSVNVWKCGAGLLYEQDMEEFHKTFAQCCGSNIITYEGWDGVHYEFENSLDPLL